MTDTKLSRKDVTRAIADRTGHLIKDVAEILSVLEDVTAEALAEGKSVTVACGILKPTEHAARNGVKPGTTEKITIPARKSVKFKLGQPLKDKLNG